MKHTPIPGVREDRRTGQYVPTLDGKDVSPTSYDRDRAATIAQRAAEVEARKLCLAIHPNDPNTYCTREAGHPGDHCRAQFGTQTPSGHGYSNIWWPQTLIREQQTQAQEQTPKHTQGRLSVHGCALYEQDNWQNGNNLARKLPVAITYHPEADREPSETEIANAQEIARRWNAFLDAKTPRAVCFHDDQPQPQAEPAPAPQQTQAKHTPGPWKVDEYEKQSVTDCGEIALSVSTSYPEALCNGQRSIAVMTGGYYTRKDQKNRSEAIATNRANARLIAAAPQLLEALRNLVETPEVRIEDMEQARAAIAAATGE